MKIRKCMQSLLILVVASGFTIPVVRAESSAPVTKVAYGTIVGIVTNAAKLPVAGATVTAARVDGGGIRATVSNSDGVYSFADLPPGAWAITAEVNGAPEVVVPSVEVTAGKATRHDLVMNVPAAGPAAAPALAAAPTGPAAAPGPSAAQIAAIVPEALQAPELPPAVDNYTPFANDGDIGWLNGNTREKSPIFDTKFFTPEIRVDVNYLQSLNHPQDHTIDGSTEAFRSGEFQIEQVSFGGDFHWNNVRARFLSMYGMFATTTPRNDASGQIGQWDLQGAYRYFSEANAGYHFDVSHGLNVDAGVFVSYIGLFS